MSQYLARTLRNLNLFAQESRRDPFSGYRKYNFKTRKFDPIPRLKSRPMPLRRASYRRRPFRRRYRRRRAYGGRRRLYRFKSRMRKRVGNPTWMQTCQSHNMSPNNPGISARNIHDLATRTLYGMEATDVAKMDSNFLKTGRFFQQINLKGIRIDMQVRNVSTSPLIMNVAVISSKNDKPSLTAGTSNNPSTFDNTDGFFRFYGNSRDVNFDNNRSSMEINYNPIDTDKWNVHLHTRRSIAPIPATTSTAIETYNNILHFRKYVSINRAIRFNDDTGVEAETPIFIVWWIENLEINGGGTSTPIAAQAKWQQNSCIFFTQGRYS